MERKDRRLKTSLVGAALAVAVAAPAVAAPEPAGHLTDQSAYITLDPRVPKGARVTPIISVGESVDGVLFEGIPDGIGLKPGPAKQTVEVFVAHEQSRVPFSGARDVQDSSVTSWVLSTQSGPGRKASVLSAEEPIPASAGFIRFCSAFMAGPAEGFSSYTFFTGEESNDAGLAVPVDAPYGSDVFPGNGTRQAGYSVGLNTDTAEFSQITRMGRLNHENTVVVPGGWSGYSVLTTDDTFNAPSSQLYLFRGDTEQDVRDGDGTLYAFRVTGVNGQPVDPANPSNGANDYLDLGIDDSFTGEFIPVPDDIADGTTQTLPQTALENWSNENNVMQFIRLEDLAYDKKNPLVVYAADTGATRVVPDANTGRLIRGPGGTVGQADNGRILQFVFNADDPLVVDSLTVLADGDAPGTEVFVPLTSPDNLDVSTKSLMVQEDTGQAVIWQYRFKQGDWRVVATVNDPVGESSGIVDASEFFGPGTWLLDVQAHGTNVFEDRISESPTVIKREDGQLMLLEIPGS
ncbi:MAG TPA: alkaline phosphatase PhoX [Acidimicrobiia bacterium]|nr:alkaline phosphatase PhoX [Acidimicrobiia bacterium]